MVGVQEALLACPKMRIIDPNIKKAQNIVMERDSENPTPTIDIEPGFQRILKHINII